MTRFNQGFAGGVLVLAVAGGSTAAEPATKLADVDASYTAAIDKRADDILAALKLPDPAVAARVHATLTNRYRELRDWHAAHDTELKTLGWKADAPDSPAATKEQIDAIQADRLAKHDAFIKALAVDLSPGQVDVVKDALVYNKVQVTYAAYQQIVPNLTEPQKAKLLEFLKQAREEAMDGGSVDEKSAVFKRYKNFCKAYLVSQGHDVNQDYKNWGDAQKKKQPASKPAAD